MTDESGSRRTSLAIYAVLVLWTAAVAVLSRTPSTPNLRDIPAPQVVLAACGFFGILALRRAKLPELWNTAGPRRILAMPFVVGMAFGFINAICVQWLMPLDRSAPMPPFLQPFPWSVALFSAGAVVMEATFCLIPLPLLTATLLRFARSPAASWPYLAAAAIVVGAQACVLFGEIPPPVRFLVPVLAVFNVIQIIFFRRFGYLASLSARLGHYAVWHVGLGLWFERF